MSLPISLSDLKNEKVYVKIKSEIIKDLFSHATKLAGSEVRLAKQLGKKRIYNIWNYKNGLRFVPLRLTTRILEVLPSSQKVFYKTLIEGNIESIRYGYGKGKCINYPKFPITFSPIISRIAGHITGDGGVNTSREVYYTNQCTALTDQFKMDILEIFGEVNAYEYFKDTDKTTMIRFPSIIGVILIKLFGYMVSEYKHVPDIIIKSNKTSKSLFLRALFDDEGCVSSNRVCIGMSNKGIIEKIHEFLKEFGMRPGKITKREATGNWSTHYGFSICGQADIKLFKSEIGFDHPDKSKKLDLLIQNYSGKNFKSKKGEIQYLICRLLDNKSLTAKEIAKKLNKKLNRTIYKHLEKLEKDNIIKSIKQGKLKIYTKQVTT